MKRIDKRIVEEMSSEWRRLMETAVTDRQTDVLHVDPYACNSTNEY